MNGAVCAQRKYRGFATPPERARVDDAKGTLYFTASSLSTGANPVTRFVPSDAYNKTAPQVTDKHLQSGWWVANVESWISRYYRQLDEFKELQDNWNGYGSEAPNNIALTLSHELGDILHEREFEPTRVLPSAEEGVGVSFASGEKRAIIECFNDGDVVAVTYEDDGEPRVWEVGSSEVDLREAVDHIYDFIHGA